MMEWCSTSRVRKHVALSAMGGMMKMLHAWCVDVDGVVLVGTMVTLVTMAPTKAREEHSQCDVISSR